MNKKWLNLKLDPEDGNGNVAETLGKIERGVEKFGERLGEVEKQVKALTPAEEVLKDQSRWPKELKAVFDDMTKLKTTANGLDSEIKKLEAAFKKIDTLTRLEARSAFGDPIKRFCADEEKRNFINALARKLAFPNAKLPEHLEKALTGVDSSLGQATIPTHYIPELYDILERYGTYNTLRVDRVGARTNSYPIMTARPTAVWIGAGSGAAEGTAITPGDFTGTSVNLAIQTAAALLYASREQLADATVDMSSVILAELAQSVAYLLDFMAFQANGGSDQVDAGYYGIFETATVHTGCKAEAASGNKTIAQLKLDDFVRCITTVSSRVLSLNPRWWIHPQNLAKICLVRDENGRPIFQNALEAPTTTVGSILGAPVVPTPAAPAADQAEAKIAVYGDPQSYIVGIRQDIELASSEHIKFAENQIGFRAILRAGGKHRIPSGNPAGFKPMVVLTTPEA